MHTIFVRTTMQVSIYCSYNEISYLDIIWVFYCFLVAFSAISFFSDFRMCFCSYVCVLLHLCCMGYCLSFLMWFYFFVETFVTEFVLVPLFSVAPDADSNSASTASTFFRWLSLFPSTGLDMFTLIYAFLASIIALCGLLRGPGHLFNLFSTLYDYFSTDLVCFWSIVKEPTLFSFIGSSTLSSFWIKSVYDPFLIQLKKKPY